MAAGGEKGCSLASDAERHRQLRGLWKDWLEAQDLGEPGLLDVAPGQPLHLKLLRAMLEAAGDPDRGFLRQAEEGLPVGDPRPATSHAARLQIAAEVAAREFPLGSIASLGTQLQLG